MAFICEICTGEEEVSFPTLKQLVEHKKEIHEGKRPAELAPESVQSPTRASNGEKGSEVPPKPIVLKYKYEGACAICGRELDTIQVEMDERNIMIAYCSVDKKQWVQREVIPLQNQKPIIVVNEEIDEEKLYPPFLGKPGKTATGEEIKKRGRPKKT